MIHYAMPDYQALLGFIIRSVIGGLLLVLTLILYVSCSICADSESRRYSDIELARDADESGQSRRLRPSVDLEGMEEVPRLEMMEDDALPMMDDDFHMQREEDEELPPMQIEEDQLPAQGLEEEDQGLEENGERQSALADVSLNISMGSEGRADEQGLEMVEEIVRPTKQSRKRKKAVRANRWCF